MAPQVSLMIHTASYDNFLNNQGIPSYFQAVTENLSKQHHKDFEFIYVDTFHDENKDQFENVIKNLPFVVKHVPVHSNHRYWYDQGYTYISAAKNTGILYADGELLVTCDDGEFFPKNFLEKYWHYYQSGHLMHAYHKRMKSVETENGFVKYPIKGDIYINDTRMTDPKDGTVKYHTYGSWMYAGTSFTLSTALRLNGFNERLDAYKSLEDCDFGIRMSLAGEKFVLDKEVCLYIVDHISYVDTPRKKKISEFIALENYGTLLCAKKLFEIEANKHPITDRHLEIIQAETIKYRNFDPLTPENADKFEIWLKTPTFDLKQEREELRKSSDWKW